MLGSTVHINFLPPPGHHCPPTSVPSKAELGCGMAPSATANARAADPQWMVNGKFGVVQLAFPEAEE